VPQYLLPAFHQKKHGELSSSPHRHIVNALLLPAALYLSTNRAATCLPDHPQKYKTANGCDAETTLRGLYNEMISNDLNNHRKVFEILGDKLKCEKVNANEQLSGLGFSSTLRKSLTVKVTGADKSVKQYIIKF
jgi:hypothetical protein